jgi:hypothetical protein
VRLANGTLPWPWIDPDKALPWVEQRIGLALAESQEAAIRLALMSKVLVMHARFDKTRSEHNRLAFGGSLDRAEVSRGGG